MVLGKQGAGKGTQCVRLSHHYVVPHVSTGDMLRAAVKSGHGLGQKAKELMDSGELLGDDLIMEMVAERLAESRRPGPGLRARRLPPHHRPGRAPGRPPRPRPTSTW